MNADTAIYTPSKKSSNSVTCNLFNLINSIDTQYNYRPAIARSLLSVGRDKTDLLPVQKIPKDRRCRGGPGTLPVRGGGVFSVGELARGLGCDWRRGDGGRAVRASADLPGDLDDLREDRPRDEGSIDSSCRPGGKASGAFEKSVGRYYYSKEARRHL